MLEPRAAARVVGERIGKHFYRYRSPEPRIERPIHFTHTAGAQQRLDAKCTDLVTWCKLLHRL